MATATEPRTTGPGLDEPTVAHMADGKVWVDGDMFTALCGARLIGIPAEPDARRCERCLEILKDLGLWDA